MSVEQSVSIESIREALQKPLAGWAAQSEMAPQPARDQLDRRPKPAHCREAGVLLLLYPWQQELYIILTLRQGNLTAHSGQISLPGGKREGQETVQATALRETEEEIGVSPESVELVGRLTCLYVAASNFCIYPFVGFRLSRPVFQPDAQEVAELIETPLSLLFDSTIRREAIWSFAKYGKRRVPFFQIYSHQVWGATAMILNEFLTQVTTYARITAEYDNQRMGYHC